MNTDELLEVVRSTGIPTADLTFTTTRILREMTDMQKSLFEKLLIQPREGYLMYAAVMPTAAGVSYYRIPHRAAIQGAERIEIQIGTKYGQLVKESIRNASQIEPDTGVPRIYVMGSDSFQLYPTPNAVYNLRVHFYIRPNNLVPQQSTATGTDRGRITSIDTASLAVSLNAIPYNMLLATPAAITSADLVDVIRPNGSHEIVLGSAGQVGFIGTVMTFSAGTDISRVRIGDYVRAAEQSDWPQLPNEFHRTLADATAAGIWVAKGYQQKAQALAQKVQSDLGRYAEMLQPRVKDSPKQFKPRYGILRGRSGLMRRYPR